MEMPGGSGGAAQAQGGQGLVMHGGHGTRFLAGDNNARLNLWVDARRVERALESLLDEPLREPLVFRPSLDWTSGTGVSLRRLFGLLVEGSAQPGGLPSNAAAMASFADLLTQTIAPRPTTRVERGCGCAAMATPVILAQVRKAWARAARRWAGRGPIAA